MFAVEKRLALIALAACATFPAFAEDTPEASAGLVEVSPLEASSSRNGAPEATVTAQAETPEVEMSEPEVVYATPETDYSTANVWWGNRSVSHDHYIKFDRIVMAAAPSAMAGPPPVNPLVFDKKKAILRPEGAAELDKAIAYLNADPNSKAVITPNGASVGLSEAAIHNYLVEHGIPASRITSDTSTPGPTVVIPYRSNR